ncbi:MAG: HAD family hydrolase [Chloroflexota bacterium]|nr:HAD family hydrolase [Chloroflexota bacterium]
MLSSKIKGLLVDFDKTLGFMSIPHLEMYSKIAFSTGINLSSAELTAAMMVKPLSDTWSPWQTKRGIEHFDESKSEVSYRELRYEIAFSRLKEALKSLDFFDENILRLAAEKISKAESDLSLYELYPDTVEFLRASEAQNIDLAVVSNHDWVLPEVLSHLGIARYFKAIVTSARTGVRKPHPLIFDRALRDLNLGSEQVVMIGDSMIDDIGGAKSVGIDAVLIDRTSRIVTDDVLCISTLSEIYTGGDYVG